MKIKLPVKIKDDIVAEIEMEIPVPFYPTDTLEEIERRAMRIGDRIGQFLGVFVNVFKTYLFQYGTITELKEPEKRHKGKSNK